MAQAGAKTATSPSTAATQPAVPRATVPQPKKKKQGNLWIWEAKTRSGEIKKGEMEANDAAAVDARLKSLGLTPSKVRRKSIFDSDLAFGGSATQKDLLIFTRQFATMIDAGLPLVQCLEILGSQTENPAMRKCIFAVKGRVEAGSTFSDALKDHPKIFDELYVQLCAAGEVGGILDTILNRLAAYKEKADKLKRKVKGAMTYPIVVITVAIGVTAVLLLKVTPVFKKMFSDFGSALPAPTQIVCDFSDWLVANIFYLIASIVTVIVVCSSFYKNKKGRIIFDKVILHVPMIGDLLRKVAVARFTRTLGTMVSSGVPILDALEVTAKTAGNRTVESAIYYTRTKISEGKNIAGPLSETKVFPSMVVQMIGVGEATGAMDAMLNKIADFYDDEADTAVSSLTAMIEPLLMVFLGAVVGGFLVAMYLPIFSIAGAVK
jgi:type IV pilus assembly protein PilC